MNTCTVVFTLSTTPCSVTFLPVMIASHPLGESFSKNVLMSNINYIEQDNHHTVKDINPWLFLWQLCVSCKYRFLPHSKDSVLYSSLL